MSVYQNTTVQGNDKILTHVTVSTHQKTVAQEDDKILQHVTATVSVYQ